ncbi:aldehyde dehydrogenase family protein [Halomonas sp. ZH2S]|uniref:Aldehyde dehydrogenase family protein n=1 Tax=Vreelandella zhuhanensis TaxID=2684210 RepID=A0A7X3H2Z9_9GAMM|nr:aldehyde dehydrogenase family protein [Halomonas zhuhanensis]MWJ28555.1 aldehyde dehydrogenase family protein [Halomonas zhuhanensis]
MSDVSIERLPEVEAFLKRATGSYIDGSFVAGAERKVDVFNPATGEALSQVGLADETIVDRAVSVAKATFDSKKWRGMKPAQRERILLKFADLLEKNSEEFAQIETLNQGKSINITRLLDVGYSVDFMRYMAGWTTKIEGKTVNVSIGMPEGAEFNAYTIRQPVGVVAGIVPWNFPLMIALWKIMPALATGCSVVIKPASETPLSALRLAELAIEAGVPSGVFNVVVGPGSTAGAQLSSHPDVRKVTFTGSTVVGKQIGHAAVDHMAHFALELGGKNPMLVLEDADLDKAVQGALLAGLLNQGQVCAAASRFYVHRSIYDAFCQRLYEAVSQMSVGPGMDPTTQLNPLVSKRHQQSVLGYIDKAEQEGARVLRGAEVPDDGGYYVSPIVLADVTQDMTVAREEIFGPVLSVIVFDDVDEALRMVNDSDLGLSASIWTNNLTQAMRLIPEIEAGTVWVNTHVTLDSSLPFGGFKQSGIGREFGREAVESFTEIKSVCIAY